MRDDQAMGATWRHTGSRRRLKPPAATRAAILRGAVAPATGDVMGEQYAESTAETVQQLLQGVLNRYVGQRIYWILDNAKIHHAQALAPFLADHAARHLVFLPPYSPNHIHNVERLGKWLREKVILYTYFPNLGAIKDAVGRFLRFLEKAKTEIPSRLCRLPCDPKKT